MTELDKQNVGDKAWSRDMKLLYEHDLMLEIGHVEDVLEKGKETGLTLSAEEVQRLCMHLNNCRRTMSEMVDDDSW